MQAGTCIYPGNRIKGTCLLNQGRSLMVVSALRRLLKRSSLMLHKIQIRQPQILCASPFAAVSRPFTHLTSIHYRPAIIMLRCNELAHWSYHVPQLPSMCPYLFARTPAAPCRQMWYSGQDPSMCGLSTSSLSTILNTKATPDQHCTTPRIAHFVHKQNHHFNSLEAKYWLFITRSCSSSWNTKHT